MKNKSVHPPKWANRLLEWYCKPELFEDLQGDLYEYFERNLEAKGSRRARFNYVMDVLKFFKPYTVRKLEILGQLTQFIMFKNYFKTSIRSIGRNKLFSAINVFGLAISMSVCLLMITMFSEVKNYDRFHADHDRIHRVTNAQKYLNNEPNLFASTSILAGRRLKEEVPGLEAATIITRSFSADAKIGDNTFPFNAPWADNDFFKVFSFNLLRGDATAALSEPYSVILTDETAEKFFPGQDPMDQTILMNEQSYRVTGVVEKPPFNSHFKFSALISFSTYEQQQKQTEEDWWLNWHNMWSNYAYFKLDKNTTIDQVQARLTSIADDENSRQGQTKIFLSTQALTNIMSGPDLSNQLGESIGNEALWILGVLAFIVILSAGFNYTNLSIARSLRRAKEVGVRKVVGASKKQVFTQFTIEACIISVCSLILAYLLFFLLKPLFLNLSPEMQRSLKLEHEPIMLLYFLLFAIVVGISAGFIPSLFLSRLRAIQVLKDASTTRLFSKINLRKVLIVVQFTLSLAFIISASIANRQFKYALNFDLGFDTENVLNISLAGNDPYLTKAVFEQIPEITDISMSSHVLSTGNRYANQAKSEDGLDSATVYLSQIDHKYIPLMGHELLAGTNFVAKDRVEKEETVIVNETILNKFKLGTPEEAIGKVLKFGPTNSLIVQGVVKNFHYATLDSEIESFAFRHQPQNAQMLNLKIMSENIIDTRRKIEEAWLEFDEVHEFRGSFYDDRIEAAYSEFEVMFTVVGFLAFITITISALGLLGMGVYTAETRLKEISIRKVLGASEGSLIRLLSRGFMWLLLIASLIAIPSTYYLFDSVLLSDQAHRADIGVMELILGVMVIFVIGFTTIGSQTWKAAKSNPAQTLRSE
ncbi:ABC transporter permease [Roseivirga sp. E12]|uniref:ABC transporter permease n=1 Tax=Roseivirga sp. E12 TaxID=2819237 RepID=UPI001ABC3DC5|nr:ABC transporter permease [Roseivirga sp. E12]MBO3700115.1 ABC transporter permease [Roseivirga sp. E12]